MINEGKMKFFEFTYDYVFVIQIMAISASLIVIFYPFKKDWKNILIAFAHFAFLFALGTLINWALFAIAEHWRWLAGINFQFSWLFMIVIYLCTFRGYIMSKIILAATIYTTIISICDLGRNIPLNIDVGITCIICYIFIVAFSFVIRKFTILCYSDIPPISVIMIMINTTVFTTLIFYRDRYGMTVDPMKTDVFYTMTLIVIYILSISSYMMIYFHCKVRKEKTSLEVQNKLLEADKQMLIVSEQAIEEMRSIRHDMKNQQKVMGLMLAENRFDDLKEYFGSVADKTNYKYLSEFIDCGNQLINSIINMEILKATSYGVNLITKINVSETLPFDKSDLCRILVNLIDNAIEAILRTENRNYAVDVKIANKNDYLYISVENEIRSDVDRDSLLKLNTVKDDAVNHGYGHKIVKKIVEKYNGYVNYTVEGSEFIAEVMLDLKDTQYGQTN